MKKLSHFKSLKQHKLHKPQKYNTNMILTEKMQQNENNKKKFVFLRLLLQYFHDFLLFVVVLWKNRRKTFHIFQVCKGGKNFMVLDGKSALRKQGEIFIRSLFSRQLLDFIELSWVCFLQDVDEAPEILAIHKMENIL